MIIFCKQCFFNKIFILLILYEIISICNAIPSSNTNDITDNEDDYPVATATHNPAWWSRKVQRRPILISNGSPIGTGVPTWREVDLFGRDNRKGRSFTGAQIRSANGSTSPWISSLSLIMHLSSLTYLIINGHRL